MFDSLHSLKTYRVFFLTVPPNFQYQKEKRWAANQRFCSMKFSAEVDPRFKKRKKIANIAVSQKTYLPQMIYIFLTPHSFANRSHFVNVDRPTSGDQNRVKTAPQPNFAQKAFVPLCIPVFSPFMAHPNILLRFRVTPKEYKISVFH